MTPKARFINGVFAFEGKGLETTAPVDATTNYTVPSDKRAQFIYLRAGNSSGELIFLVMLSNGKPMRYFPVGAKASVHVSLAVVEDIFPESRLELRLGAPAGTRGTVVLDIGLLEVD